MEDPALAAGTPTLHAAPSRDLHSVWFLRAGEAPLERRAGGGACEDTPPESRPPTVRDEPGAEGAGLAE